MWAVGTLGSGTQGPGKGARELARMEAQRV